MQQYLASTLFVFAAAACGGTDLDPGAGNDPGTGTSTLVVDGSASASPRVDNARAAADFETDFSVRVRKDGQPITSGTVRVTSASGVVDLVFDTSDNEARWRGRAPGYDEVYILDVISGEDRVEGVRVDGPDAHHFTAPAPGASVDATQPLVLTWTGEDTAASAVVKTENIDDIAIDDTRTYELPAGSLKRKREEAEQNELRIRRTNRVVPAGAAGGSELTVSVENRITVLAQPDPAL